MASVYAGRVRSLGGFERKVAIKCCHPHLRGDQGFEAMFFDEARIAAAIHHPNVVATLDVGVDGDTIYQVMEFIEGAKLSDLTREGSAMRPLPIAVCARILVEVLRGLHAAHELADAEGTPLLVVHRDVSPQNVLVGVDGVTRIMDFGIARAVARATVTQDGVIKGKIAYMAPEQLLAQAVDRRADLFAAGVVLWEALSGQRLFVGDTQVDTMQRVLNLPIDPPSSRCAEAAPLDAVVMRALARNPLERFDTARAFADAIEAATELARPAEVGAVVRSAAPAPSEDVGSAPRGGVLDALPTTAGAHAPGREADLAPLPQEGVSEIRQAAPPRRLSARARVGVLVVAGVAVTIGVAAALDWSRTGATLPSAPAQTPAAPPAVSTRPPEPRDEAAAGEPAVATPTPRPAEEAPPRELAPPPEPPPVEAVEGSRRPPRRRGRTPRAGTRSASPRRAPPEPAARETEYIPRGI